MAPLTKNRLGHAVMPASKSTVPRHEPEVVEATARKKYDGDVSRAPNTALKDFVVNGIQLSSRHSRAEELEAMADMVATLPASLAFDIDAVHCDSKVGWAFQLTLTEWCEDLACSVARSFEAACFRRIGGHGGLWVVPDPKLRIAACLDVDGRWQGSRP